MFVGYLFDCGLHSCAHPCHSELTQFVIFFVDTNSASAHLNLISGMHASILLLPWYYLQLVSEVLTIFLKSIIDNVKELAA